MRLGRPIVLFVMDEEHLTRKADIESNPGELEKLDAFRERAKHLGDRSEVERVYEMFETWTSFQPRLRLLSGSFIQHLDRKASEPLAASTPATEDAGERPRPFPTFRLICPCISSAATRTLLRSTKR